MEATGRYRTRLGEDRALVNRESPVAGVVIRVRSDG
jgi:hypothetical protein